MYRNSISRDIKKCRKCKGKIYEYQNTEENLHIDLCYKCGYFHCRTDYDVDFTQLALETPSIVPFLIKIGYLKAK